MSEQRLERVEAQIAEIWEMLRENQRQMSELRSDISTLATIAGTHDGQIEQVGNQMGQLGSRMEQLIQAQAQSQQRFDQFVERSDRDRELMLQLIQQIAQGRNGGN